VIDLDLLRAALPTGWHVSDVTPEDYMAGDPAHVFVSLVIAGSPCPDPEIAVYEDGHVCVVNSYTDLLELLPLLLMVNALCVRKHLTESPS